ncbi:RND family efflux transporter MFP subunit [Rhodothalassium salexigens DSM 2132]|uniref:RND family efflux transporter MFP subunit n=1 Tax=Rhodothalassium salexigens DSM 2132 TaxID=1188247 RepID=A0A4V2SQ78_RHOSA|nr:HlyD family efflux transporter periplasmic adaptor subunit [Rhodothalassium salexigens]MBB4210517.1 multidrug efflux pump subunit AcrA (membrane-fusion protein) [Rhodothalassium salexigens DSM 2132]MBK1638072.1 RND transporter [Rhodothalassium salexigens DSM 2132]TCP37926.1 RND family efflux transporter MFP subunit [Rhodothalassium salexigens DSM 2132]
MSVPNDLGFRGKHLDTWQTLDSIRIPRVMRMVVLIILATILIGGTFLYFTPWVQTASGRGVVTALDPRDRQQDINALVGGRIEQWFVRDGSTVKKGDPIVRLVDNDPQLVERLKSEMQALERKVIAAEQQVSTAEYDARRQKELYEEGLSSRLAYENAQIKLEDLRSKLASARAELKQAEVRLSRQSIQTVRAPRDGTILTVNAGDSATFIQQGQRVATFIPEDVKRAVQLFVDGRDAALVEEGRPVRLQFEGWPAVQFSGWPSVAVGTFAGRVAVVDRGANLSGQFRIMVVEDPDGEPWPEERFVRLGTQARGWVLLDTVRLGYELWRQMNNFPPNFTVPGGSGGQGGGQGSGQGGASGGQGGSGGSNGAS